MTLATSITSDISITEGKEVSVDVFHLDQIPDAMDNMGWEMAAKLMRHWFSITPAFAFDEAIKEKYVKGDSRLIPPERYNDSIVTMAWAMKFEQAKDAVDKLKTTWHTQRAIATLQERLTLLGDKGVNGYAERCMTLGQENRAVMLDATAQVNLWPVGELMDTMNDWYGALGKATLKVALRGYTSVLHEKKVFIVDGLGFYFKDTYDFLDDVVKGIRKPEPLGVWGKKGVLSKTETALYMSSYLGGFFGDLARNHSGYVPVFNSDFRAWQQKHNSGGDFIVFSDVLWLPPLEKDRVVYL